MGLIAAVLATAGSLLATGAGADDTHTYKLVMYNAFGLVTGSEVKVADVNTGTITDLAINGDKRAVATVELSGPLSTLGEDTVCSSEPQSLIAEYFLTCTPKGKPLPDGASLPPSQVKLTVQNDLVFNTLRMPFKQRLQILINEFGTALAGNPEALNDAIRLGAPALSNLHKALRLLGDQNTVIRDLTSNSDRIIARLTERKADVVRFIKEAGETASASAERRNDLSTNFDLLDNFLAELQPTSVQLAAVARSTTPLLKDLRAAAPGLTTLSERLPAFNRSTERSLTALGKASAVGETALRHAENKGVIRALADSGRNAFATADPLAKLLRDIDDPKRSVEEDQRAAKSCADKTRPCYSTGRKAPTGYTGLEGLLNYAYYQAGSTNQFDDVGHILHFTLYDVFAGQCGKYNADKTKLPAQGGGTIDGANVTDLNQLANCVGWLGPDQPGITTPDHAGPYDPSVCPAGSSEPQICDPAGPKQKRTAKRSGGGKQNSKPRATRTRSAPPSLEPGAAAPAPAAGSSPSLPSGPNDTAKGLGDILGLPSTGVGGGLGGKDSGNTKSTGGTNQAAQDLLDFLFSP